MWHKAKMVVALVITILIFNLTKLIQWPIHIYSNNKIKKTGVPNISGEFIFLLFKQEREGKKKQQKKGGI